MSRPNALGRRVHALLEAVHAENAAGRRYVPNHGTCVTAERRRNELLPTLVESGHLKLLPERRKTANVAHAPQGYAIAALADRL